jgi:hypothetical protein
MRSRTVWGAVRDFLKLPMNFSERESFGRLAMPTTPLAVRPGECFLWGDETPIGHRGCARRPCGTGTRRSVMATRSPHWTRGRVGLICVMFASASSRTVRAGGPGLWAAVGEAGGRAKPSLREWPTSGRNGRYRFGIGGRFASKYAAYRRQAGIVRKGAFLNSGPSCQVSMRSAGLVGPMIGRITSAAGHKVRSEVSCSAST